MLSNLKSTVLLTLFATSFALPTTDPETHPLFARAGIPDKVTCPGKGFTKSTIIATLKAAHTKHPKYPEPFVNKSCKEDYGKTVDCFTVPGNAVLLGYPLTDPVWTGGEPGKYRVIFNTKTGRSGKHEYVGVMYYSGGTLKKC
ncbi:hypothetical protein CC86DRAFT_409825 [Ophiobolus disseminans]|uniref:Uncharacterized protein n=1 Tax=Ophiobolus disseminans TaxID=1469910 RepID=A0A6A6ZRI1_9PLEO|nr:hypothetical protein CC86DRAFT_409825 [Ophiobolus disseminans]